jgi:hypothetical protein
MWATCRGMKGAAEGRSAAKAEPSIELPPAVNDLLASGTAEKPVHALLLGASGAEGATFRIFGDGGISPAEFRRSLAWQFERRHKGKRPEIDVVIGPSRFEIRISPAGEPDETVLIILARSAAEAEKLHRVYDYLFGEDNEPDDYLFGEDKEPIYDGNDPPSEAAEPPPLRMRDDLNTAVKNARRQVFRRARPAALAAAFKAMVKNVDLLNPDLPADERLRRSRRLVRTYERVRKRNPKFHDDSPELRAARSIINKFQYQQRQKSKQAAASMPALG